MCVDVHRGQMFDQESVDGLTATLHCQSSKPPPDLCESLFSGVFMFSVLPLLPPPQIWLQTMFQDGRVTVRLLLETFTPEDEFGI